MIKVEYLFLCDFVNITQEGKLNVSGIFNQINLNNVPTVLSKAVVVGKIFVSSSYNAPNISVDFELIGDEKKLNKKLPSIKLPVSEKYDKLTGGRNLIFGFDIINLPIEKEGLYKFTINVDGKIKAETAFVAKLKK